MKRFLLTAGDSYYPQSGDGDWVDMFETREEAEAQVITKQEHEYFSRGPRKGQIKESHTIRYIKDRRIDWYEVIDLETWHPNNDFCYWGK